MSYMHQAAKGSSGLHAGLMATEPKVQFSEMMAKQLVGVQRLQTLQLISTTWSLTIQTGMTCWQHQTM